MPDSAEEKKDDSNTESDQHEMNPLQMGDMLEKIFTFLDGKSLKEARQVNELWSVEGAKMLINKCYVRIPSDLPVGESSKKKNKRNKIISMFEAFLAIKSRETIMIPNIIVEGVRDIESWKSLGVLGGQVKSLNLNFIEDEGAENEELLPSLLELLPNLKYLSLDKMYSWKKKEHIIKVLTAKMSKSEKTGNPVVISCLSLQANKVSELEDIEKLVDCGNILLEDLKFIVWPYFLRNQPQFGDRILKVISNILSTSRNILKKLSLERCEIYLSLSEFPCMAALTQMAWQFSSQSSQLSVPCHYEVPPSFRFSENVPNLVNFEINCKGFSHSSGQEYFSNLFGNSGTVPSVKKLKCSGCFSGFPMDSMFQVFPNIEDLYTKDVVHSQSMLETLWKRGTNLKKLDIEIHIDRLNSEGAYLDSVFTGFDPNTAKRIRENRTLVPFTSEELEEMRTNPSILNLKALKDLHLRLNGNFIYYNKMPKRMMVVVGDYAFKLMPRDTRISIFTKDGFLGGFKPSLKGVSKLPNVTIF